MVQGALRKARLALHTVEVKLNAATLKEATAQIFAGSQLQVEAVHA